MHHPEDVHLLREQGFRLTAGTIYAVVLQQPTTIDCSTVYHSLRWMVRTNRYSAVLLKNVLQYIKNVACCMHMWYSFRVESGAAGVECGSA